MGFEQTFNTRVIPAAQRAFGEDVTLGHGLDTTDTFTAIWDDQQYEVADEEGYATKFHSRDFEFDKSSATVNGELFEPRAGDIINVTENGEAKKFEILPMGSMPAVEEMAGGFRWLVHTKQVPA